MRHSGGARNRVLSGRRRCFATRTRGGGRHVAQDDQTGAPRVRRVREHREQRRGRAQRCGHSTGRYPNILGCRPRSVRAGAPRARFSGVTRRGSARSLGEQSEGPWVALRVMGSRSSPHCGFARGARGTPVVAHRCHRDQVVGVQPLAADGRRAIMSCRG